MPDKSQPDPQHAVPTTERHAEKTTQLAWDINELFDPSQKVLWTDRLFFVWVDEDGNFIYIDNSIITETPGDPNAED